MRNVTAFLATLRALIRTGMWNVSIEKRCIHLRRVGSDTIYSPLTAVYYHLTGKELHRGSFIHPEITRDLGLPHYLIPEISYAEIACEGCGVRYNRDLRDNILSSLRQEREQPSRSDRILRKSIIVFPVYEAVNERASITVLPA